MRDGVWSETKMMELWDISQVVSSEGERGASERDTEETAKVVFGHLENLGG